MRTWASELESAPLASVKAFASMCSYDAGASSVHE